MLRMSCFFCSSCNHVSQNCDIYKSDDDRRKLLGSKNICDGCLIQRDIRLLPCKHCRSRRKCYICFSKTHHTVFCPDRFTASNTVLPNIDKDLLPRFMKMLSTQEKYSLFLSSSIDPDFVKLKPFKVKSVEYMHFFCFSNFSKCDFVFAEETYLVLDIPYELYSKNIVFLTKHLYASRTSMSSNKFLKLLSSTTKTVTCERSEFDSKLAIIDILKNAPNLENIQLQRSNVEISNSWLDDLLKFGRKLKKICLSVPDLGFNLDNLVALMKKTSINVSLFIPIVTKNGRFNEKKASQKVTNQLSKYFIPMSSKIHSAETGLFVHIHDEFGSAISTHFVMKNA